MANKAAGTSKLRLDLATLGGLVVAVAAIVGGLILEGGSLHDISQVTALLIVLGGTLGAVMVHYPLAALRGGIWRLRDVLFESPTSKQELVELIYSLAHRARRTGMVSLEDEFDNIADPFLRKALNLAVDGVEGAEIRRVMELEITIQELRVEHEAKIWESAGSYSPTVGIIGAVMGLIQVMKNLADIDRVGHGIAVSFVATVYGVAFANLLFLPAGNKIKARARLETESREMMLEGVLAIVDGLNPKLIKDKLEMYLDTSWPNRRGKK
ncbi:MAG: flagellar motor protein [Acidobacteriota bacterium]|jgi:chemotaxis protein MotA|nr:flagellar motor protein [Bryobacteraceae bacterium CoA2 C42]MCA2966851.1 flagellar motor protein [Acidobacteriaceae bacterium]